MRKSIQSGICVFVCVRKKNHSFKVTAIILKVYKKCKSPLQKELLYKASSFLYFKDRPNNGEGNKQRRRRKYMCQSN